MNKQTYLICLKNLLFESDWTQLPDSPKSVEAKLTWATYRTSLRCLYNSPGEKEVYTLEDFPTPPQ